MQISVKDMSFVYDISGNLSLCALKGISFTISRGEHVALIGSNGSGKSTLLGMIPAYIFPTSGEVRVFGHKFGNYSWKKIKKISKLSKTMFTSISI